MLPEDIRLRIAESGLNVDHFESLGQRLAAGDDLISENRLQGSLKPPPDGSWVAFNRAAPDYENWRCLGADAIGAGRLGLLILNGGMATRFGNVVKGTVPVAAGLSFLGLKLRDALRVSEAAGGEPPIIILMNSQATHQGTIQHLEENDFFGYPEDRVWSFLQCWAVRFRPDGSLFLGEDGRPSYYGPGHGDVVSRMQASGLLNRFLDSGGQHLLLSNVDNAVAAVDPALFGLHLSQSGSVTVEVVERLGGDRGGAPYLVDGKLQIVEGFRMPIGAAVDDVPVFNTNTFWLDAKSLSDPVELTWFAVAKQVDGHDVIQFERLVGELTGFRESVYAQVSRSGLSSRFIPVKTPSDLEISRTAIMKAQGTGQ